MKQHPLVTLGVGVAIGLAFGSQLRRLPLVNKIPTA